MGIQPDEQGIGVGLSRRVTVAAAVAFGVSVALPLALMPLPKQALLAAPGLSHWAFPLVVGLLLPSLVLYHFFGRVSSRGADALSAASRLRIAPLTFAVGLFSLAGYALVAALILQVLSEILSLALDETVGHAVPSWIALVSVLGFTLLKELTPQRAFWGARTWFVGTTTLLLLGAVAWQFSQVPAGPAGAVRTPLLDRSVGVVGILACLGWTTDAIFVHQGQMRSRSSGALWAALWTLLVAAVVGGVALFFLEHHSGFSLHGSRPTGGFQRSPALLAAAVLLFLLGLDGLTRMTRSLQRVTMTLWPGERTAESSFGVDLLTLLLALSVVGALARGISPLALAAAAGAAQLWSTALVSVPLVVAEGPLSRLTAKRKLPYLRLAALLALLFNVLLAILIPWGITWGLIVWLIAGFALYAALAFSRGQESRDDDPGASVELEQAQAADPAVVALLTPGASARSLARAAGYLAQRSGKRGMLLEVVEFDERLSPREQNRAAHRQLRLLRKMLAQLPGPAAELEVLVQMGPSSSEVLLDLIEGGSIELCLLSLGNGGDGDDEFREVEAICRASSLPTALLHGRFDAAHERTLLLQHAKASAARGLVDFARQLCPGEREPELVVIDREADSAAEEPDAREVSDTDESPMVESFRGAERDCWLELRNAPPSTLVVVQSAHDSVLGRATFGGRPLEEARQRSGPTIIFKPAEAPVGYLWRRATEVASELLPPLDDSDRATVLSAQGRATSASRDFYFLMVVSSLIAIAGLLANSTAVVIGAMLVAPLMSPIVGLSMGVAVASPLRLRRGAYAVSTGAGTAILVATVITMLFPIHEPTSEVSSRVSPNLLDLIVALAAGAAGSYAAARKSIAGALPGVAIAVALVPPLCVVGFGIGSGSWEIARGALLLFLTNLAGIILVSSTIFMLFGFRPLKERRAWLVRTALGSTLVGLLLITIPLATATFGSFESRLIEWRLRQATTELEAPLVARIDSLQVHHEDDVFTAEILLLAEGQLDPAEVQAFKERVHLYARKKVRLSLTVLSAKLYER